jgi:RHS repeat-associated protein
MPRPSRLPISGGYSASTGWGNSGAVSNETISSGDGYVEFSTSENNTDKLLGLSYGDTNQNYADIDFGIYLEGSGNGTVIESGTWLGSSFTYSAGDTFKVAVESGVVKYYKTHSGATTLLYTSGNTPTYSLLVDTSLYTNGATLTNVVLSSGSSSGCGSSSGWNYVLTDLQGSTRAVMDDNGSSSAVLARHDYLPFGEEIGSALRPSGQGYGATDLNRRKYGMTERDDSTGLDHTWARKYESTSGRFTSPDPYSGSMSIANPQSLNRYSYTQNDPVNYADPSGLYEGCIHEAMTKFLARLAGGYSEKQIQDLGRFAGDGPGGADSYEFAATNPWNFIKGIFHRGPSATIHFASQATLTEGMANFPVFVANPTTVWKAAFVLHSIQDVDGAHIGFHLPFGHLFKAHKPDRLLGDWKFALAANMTYSVLTGGKNTGLSPGQMQDLIQAIIKGCGSKSDKYKVRFTPLVYQGGEMWEGEITWSGGRGTPSWLRSAWDFADWVDTIGGEGNVEVTGACVGSDCPH